MLANRTLDIAAWLCLSLIGGVWVLIEFGGDRWWLATVVLFAPRTLWLIPPALLAIPATIWRRWALWPLAIAAVVVLGPIMGLNVAWPKAVEKARPTLRLLTCNIDGDRHRDTDLHTLLVDFKPDVLCFQECEDDDAPLRQVLPAGFQFVRMGELAVAAPYPLKLESMHRWHTTGRLPMYDGLYCQLTTPGGAVPVCCVHLLTPRWGLSEVLDRNRVVAPERSAGLERAIEIRTRESESVSQWLASLPGPALIAGDFNMPPDSSIFRRYWAGHGNAYSQTAFGYGCTKITPLLGLHYGLRIDHILCDPPWQAARCWLGPDVGSDHLPLLAEVSQ